MKRLLFCSCLLAVLTLSLADLSRSQTSRVSGNRALQEEQSLARVPIKVPIRLYWGYVVIVEGSIGNLHKLNFQVDTGVYPSVLDQKIAQKLGLQTKAARVNLSKRSVETQLVVLPSWPSSCRIPACSDPRPLILSESPRPQGGRDCGSGCPQESQLYHQL
jgi:aspartyl protease